MNFYEEMYPILVMSRLCVGCIVIVANHAIAM